MINVFVAGEKESPEGIRAFYLFRGCTGIQPVFRENRGLFYIEILFMLFIKGARTVYLMGFDVLAVLLVMLRSFFLPVRILYDTGDLQCALAQSFRPSFLRKIVCWLERWLLKHSRMVLSRTEALSKELKKFASQVEVVRDGVDFDRYSRFINLPEDIVVGTTGTFHMDKRTGRVGGREVIDVIVELKKRGIQARGVIAGKGNVFKILKKIARESGVDVQFIVGWTEYLNFPEVLENITFALNLQTNDEIGGIRLGGKIPPYLATGRFVISTNVEECAKLLPPEFIVVYSGSYDTEFPVRVADRIVEVLKSPELLEKRMLGLEIARREFDYNVLSDKLRSILDRLE